MVQAIQQDNVEERQNAEYKNSAEGYVTPGKDHVSNVEGQTYGRTNGRTENRSLYRPMLEAGATKNGKTEQYR